MTKLAELERAALREQAEARRWAREHKVDVPEPARQFFGGPLRRVSIDSAGTDEGLDLGGGDTWAMWEQMMLRSGRDYNPLIGGTSLHTPRDRELRARLDHVLDLLPEDQRDLLLARYVELLTFAELAERFPAKRGRRARPSYQAMQQRLDVALGALRRAFAAHFMDELSDEEVVA